MDKRFVYPGAIPLDTDILQPQRNMEIMCGFMLRAAFGTATVADGLNCTPTGPASMSVVVAPGSILFNTTVDTLAAGFGSLLLDNTDALMKMGINLLATNIGPFTAPPTSGQSQNFLIQASFSETDLVPIVDPYYNSANPTIPFSGPNNTGAAQNSVRTQTVNLQVKAGAPATTGSQGTPAPDAGNIGLWVVTIANGTVVLGGGNIAQYPGAPFIPEKLGLGGVFGFSNMRVFNSSGTFTVPNGVNTVRTKVWGGGGGGGGALNNLCAAIGGSGGGYSEGIFTVAPGAALAVTIGAAGTAGATLGGNGGAGGTTSVSGLNQATGGGFGGGASSGIQTSPTGTPGVGSGGTLNLTGNPGLVGFITGNTTLYMGGQGGASPFFATISGTVDAAGSPGNFPGCGGSGASAAAAGGAGAAGMVIIEW